MKTNPWTFGWAALLLAAATTLSPGTQAAESLQPPYSWRGIDGQGVFPAGDLVTTFRDIAPDYDFNVRFTPAPGNGLPEEAKAGTQRNIVWRTPLPNWGHNAPVVMGDRVFLLCDEGAISVDAPTMVCLSAVDGKVLYQRPVDHVDAWDEPRRTEAKRLRAREFDRLRRYLTWWNKLYWNDESDAPARHDRETWERLRAEALKDGWIFCEFEQRAGSSNGMGPTLGRAIGGWGGKSTDEELNRLARKLGQERIWYGEGWRNHRQLWYGTTMGSVVGDGEHIYAVTALGGAAAFDLEGNRLWVRDLGLPPPWVSRNKPTSGGGHVQISSPLLADGCLIWHNREQHRTWGLDAATGETRWKVVGPSTASGPVQNFQGMDSRIELPEGHKPLGVGAHMAPGGTPVAMRLSGTPVAVTGTGQVIRIADGHSLGIVTLPPPAMEVRKQMKWKKPRQYAPNEMHGGGYHAWVAEDDVLYATHLSGWLCAIKLGIDDDALTQEPLWSSGHRGDNRNPNLVYADGAIYWKFAGNGYAALEAGSGADLFGTGGSSGGYQTCLAFGRQTFVSRYGPRGLAQNNKRKTAPINANFYRIYERKTLRELGLGLLAPPITGAITARHIGTKGTRAMSWGVAGTTCWGNRIFVRSNDYLWCIGDPEKEWVPLENCLTQRAEARK